MDEKTRVPPGQRVTDRFPVLHVGDVPKFDPGIWDFKVEGEVEKPLKLSYDEFRKLGKTKDKSDFHCVTGFSLLDNVWEGVRFKTIAKLAKPTKKAKFATIFCDGGYTTSLPLEDLMEDDVLFAWARNGEELTPEHGYPLRLVVPKKYAYKSAKWARGVRFTEEQELGYWEKRGYSNTADPWTEDRYSGLSAHTMIPRIVRPIAKRL
ncbi:MAG: sulfite oxidase-like oxidoreductase [Candidatus Altiarchaeota archaeon]|nr:sulfite oxidase-like oxidoreductase [Candidatus Altiarchaeota archaeon]